ncbi:MAG TPA: RidA family protein [Alphaproteobacteria bacterium]
MNAPGLERRAVLRLAGTALAGAALGRAFPLGAALAAGRIDARLAELGVELPAAAAPVANYVGWVRTGNLVFVAGQGPILDGEVKYKGRVGADLTIEQGQAAARLCALNVLAQLKAACDGDLDRVVRCVKVGGFVNSAPDFFDQPKVVNGASDLFVEVFGDAGRHARFAVGTSVLPFNIAVEVDAHFEVS